MLLLKCKSLAQTERGFFIGRCVDYLIKVLEHFHNSLNAANSRGGINDAVRLCPSDNAHQVDAGIFSGDFYF